MNFALNEMRAAGSDGGLSNPRERTMAEQGKRGSFTCDTNDCCLDYERMEPRNNLQPNGWGECPLTHFLVDIENVGNCWINFLETSEWIARKVYLFYTEPAPRLSYAELRKIQLRFPGVSVFLCTKGENALDFQLSSYLGFLLAFAKTGERFFILSNDHGYDVVCRFWREKGYFVDRLKVDLGTRGTVMKPAGKKAEKAAKVDTSKALSVVPSAPEHIMDEATSDTNFDPDGFKTGSVSIALIETPLGENGLGEQVSSTAAHLKPSETEVGSQMSVSQLECLEFIRQYLPKKDKHQAESILSLFEDKKDAGLQVIYQTFVKVFGQKDGLNLYKHVKAHVNKIKELLNCC